MSLPRIACFHGGGSNSTIYSVQCARLEGLLGDTFQFVYFEAPFHSNAGPGILPYFADQAPFKSWFKINQKDEALSDGSGYDSNSTGGIERVHSMMREKDPEGEWIAVMGFSQGSRIAGGLLLDQQLREDSGLPKPFDLKFGVICMGSRAPMVSSLQKRSLDDEADEEATRIKIPTLHLHGLKDGNLERGRLQLANYYDQSHSRLLEIDYHHAMPWTKTDLSQFAYMIREIYEKTRQEL